MKKQANGSRTGSWVRLLLGVGLLLLIGLHYPFRSRASKPNMGTIASSGPVSPFDGSWKGDPLATGSTGGEGQCIDSGPAQNCDQFQLMVSGNASDWNTK